VAIFFEERKGRANSTLQESRFSIIGEIRRSYSGWRVFREGNREKVHRSMK